MSHQLITEPITLSVLMPVFNECFLVQAAVERVLAFTHPMIRDIQLIVVDDGSNDGTSEILRHLASEHPCILLLNHPENRGKGAAIRTALAQARGELCVIQDADLEYDPVDWGAMLVPFLKHGADVVFGSRYLIRDYRRVLHYRHTLGNRLLTALSNWMTNLNLTDMETCYKMVKTRLFQSIPLRSRGFTVEAELTAKLAKRQAVIFEVPIRYVGRTLEEGKKITFSDGLRTIAAILKWKMVDDIFAEDAYGAAILHSLTHVRRFNRWMADKIRPYVGSHVLEIGAGIGNLTRQFIPRPHYTASDIDPHYLHFLSNMAMGKPYLDVQALDLTDTSAFGPLAGRFDTVICLNVLEHIADEAGALKNISTALSPQGRAIILVPQGKWLYGSLDRVLEHVKRYNGKELSAALKHAGLETEVMMNFNKTAVLGWFINGRIFHRKNFSTIQLKLFNMLTPVLRLWDHVFPGPGLSLIAVAKKSH